MKNSSILLFLATCVLLQYSCITTHVPAAESAPIQEVTVLNGPWNDSDSYLAATDMALRMVQERWVSSFARTNKHPPVVVVGPFNNIIHGEFSAETFIRDLERAILNLKSVGLIEASGQRETLRRKNAGQQQFSSSETLNNWGRELKADFIVRGTINSTTEQIENKRVTTYQIHLELYDLATNKVAWDGNKKIRKQTNFL